MQEIYYALDYLSVFSLAQVSKAWHEGFHKCDVERLLGKAVQPLEVLRLLYIYYYHLPPQGSRAWKDERNNQHQAPKFGGSEISAILGINPFQKESVLVASKLGLAGFDGNDSTRWGNFLENMSAIFTERVFRTTIFDFGSLPGLKNDAGEVIQFYSTDGLCVLSRQALVPYTAEELPTQENFLTLCEIKNPLSRLPNGKVPAYYLPQIYTGASTIPRVELCLFIDTLFRCCCKEDFGNNSYFNRSFHDTRNDSTLHDYPVVCGFVGIYRESPPESCQKIIVRLVRQLAEVEEPGKAALQWCVGKNCASYGSYIAAQVQKRLRGEEGKFAVETSLRDYGRCEKKEFSQLLHRAVEERFLEGGWKVYYHRHFWVPPYSEFFPATAQEPSTWLQQEVRVFQTWAQEKGFYPLGYVPWKLLNVHFVPLLPHPHYAQKHREKIVRLSNLVRDLREEAKKYEGEQTEIYRHLLAEIYAAPEPGPIFADSVWESFRNLD